MLGNDAADTATVYNNIGCVMFCLERYQEAFSYCNLAHAIFQAELGQFHVRTMSVLRNLSKARKFAFVSLTERRDPWEAYPKVEFPIRPDKKKKGKKGRRK